ncbi:unnamed protein product [Cylindrotheca closterium]|uniref:Uncharacterized protein n=1 Tax=Cylindrotheca closterium TaxID=2856 RepID=A0AAD2CM27_9STRA|nr:unnamed protein product [Cylindrotheca closterium]
MMLLNKTAGPTTVTESSPAPRTRLMSFKRSNDQASKRIRSRYLHKLGVVDSSSSTSADSTSFSDETCSIGTTIDTTQSSKGSPKQRQLRRLGGRPVEIQFQPLKGSDGEDENHGPSAFAPLQRQRSLSLSENSTSTATSVSFDNYVVVHPIPSRNAYSEDMKQAIWTNAKEEEESMQRNYLEFASEGMIWQNTLEEEDFFVYNNELVHPVHIMSQHCSVNASFLMGMSADRRAYA